MSDAIKPWLHSLLHDELTRALAWKTSRKDHGPTAASQHVKIDYDPDATQAQLSTQLRNHGNRSYLDDGSNVRIRWPDGVDGGRALQILDVSTNFPFTHSLVLTEP